MVDEVGRIELLPPPRWVEWDDVAAGPTGNVRQSTWWNAPLIQVGTALDVVARTADGGEVLDGALLRSTRIARVPVAITDCLALPFAGGDGSAPALAEAVAEAASRRRAARVTLAPRRARGGDDLAEAIASGGGTVRRRAAYRRAVVSLTGRTIDEVDAACSTNHRRNMARGRALAVERLEAGHDLAAAYGTFAATARRKGFSDLRPWALLEPAVTAGIGNGVCEVIAARQDGQITAAVLLAHTAAGTEYLYGGHRDTAAGTGAPHVLHWTALVSALERGSPVYDLGQLSSARAPTGLDRFKLGFGADAVADPDLIDWDLRPRLASAIDRAQSSPSARRSLRRLRDATVRRRLSGSPT